MAAIAPIPQDRDVKQRNDLVLTVKRLCPQCRQIQEVDVHRCTHCGIRFAVHSKAPMTFGSLCIKVAVVCSVAAALVVAGARFTAAI